MAGCDYLDNIKFVGLKKAIGLIDSLKDINEIEKSLKNKKTYKDKVP
jgi:5'-3' exonuclease